MAITVHFLSDFLAFWLKKCGRFAAFHDTGADFACTPKGPRDVDKLASDRLFFGIFFARNSEPPIFGPKNERLAWRLRSKVGARENLPGTPKGPRDVVF